MSSYFFHLKLELYQTPAVAKRGTFKEHAKSTPYILPRHANIFKTVLPAHQTSKWSSYTFLKHPDTPHSLSTSGSGSPHRASATELADSHGDTLLLPDRATNRREVHRSPINTPAKPSNEAAAKDWRYDLVSIESIDMEAQAVGGALSKLNSGTSRAAAGGLHTKAIYLPSDPKTTDVGWGVVHLYRDSEESGVLDGSGAYTQSKSLNQTGTNTDGDFDPDQHTTLCILAVPSWMMPSDLLGFVGDQAREDVSHFRLIRTGRTNKYMVLMKFRSAKRAKEWQKANNGRLFSAAEPENCHVVFIKSVEFVSPESDELETFPQNHHDPFTAFHRSAHSARAETSLSSKPVAPLLELPTCPVCLERMDETTGLLTILCQHVFHCACLEKWRFAGSGCPVCRYSQSPSYTFPYPRPFPNGTTAATEDLEPCCSVCGGDANVNLWICLICGNMGCGRYDSAHAYAHYEATSHCYAMDVNTQRVWDYAGDGYVHRLIQSKPDFSTQHKVNGSASAEADTDAVPRHENEAYRSEGGDMVPREKMESMANEYTYLLTSQLEGQRRYFEEQVERAVDKASHACIKADIAASEAERALSEMQISQVERESLQDAMQRLERSLERSEKAKAKFEQMARDMSAQLREEKTMNEGLMQRITAAEAMTEQAKLESEKYKAEKSELEDMNHDLTMFISSQEKVKELQAQGEEVFEGTVSVPEQQKKKGKGKKK